MSVVVVFTTYNVSLENNKGKASGLTENDAAYLRGLYKMGLDRNLVMQREQMSYQMEQDLTGC